MLTKIVQQEIVNILSSYLYNKPVQSLTKPLQPQAKLQKDFLPNINKPLDVFLRSYLNNRQYLGSTQRSSIKDKIYNLVRYEYLLSHLVGTHPFDINQAFRPHLEQETLDKIKMLFSPQFRQATNDPSLPKQLRASQNPMQKLNHPRLFKQLSISLMPFKNTKLSFGCLQGEIGNDNIAYEVCCAMNSTSPLTIRVNPLKIAKHELMERLQNLLKLKVQQCSYAPMGLKVTASKHINILQTPQFQKGYFEIQDEGSQLAAFRVNCKPGDLILDYCGGSDGKSLAIAHLLQQRGQIFVYEPRQVAMGKIKRRFARAGVKNVQYHNSQESLNRIALGKMNWVIVNAPSTGTGSLRRNPDIKLKFTQKYLQSKIELQKRIVGKALKFVHRNGRLVYITQSLLRQQNEQQVAQLCKIHRLEVQHGEFLKTIPQKQGSDGYFAVVLKRTN